MTRYDYYRRWAVLAVTHSWGPVETVSGIVALIVPAISQFLVGDNSMIDMVWQIPLILFVTLIVVRLIQSPWWMHEEQSQEHVGIIAAMGKKHEETRSVYEKNAAARHQELQEQIKKRDAFDVTIAQERFEYARKVYDVLTDFERAWLSTIIVQGSSPVPPHFLNLLQSPFVYRDAETGFYRLTDDYATISKTLTIDWRRRIS